MTKPKHETVPEADLLKRLAALEQAVAGKDAELKAHADRVALMTVENDELKSRLENGDFQPSIGRNVMETYAGKKKVMVRKFDAVKRTYSNVEEEHEFWDYLIDLAPCQGTELRLSGQTLQHNGVYTLDLNTLRTVKEMVYRGWWHEEQIKGSQESKFRRQTLPHLSARGGPVRYEGLK